LATSSLKELRGVNVTDQSITIGAAESISQLEQTAAETIPEYANVLKYFGSPPIKNAGTIGGNIGNGSPIADSMPAMYVLNAEIELTGTSSLLRVNINDFYTGYKKTVAKPDEIITRIIIPRPQEGEILRLYKMSRRKDLDISSFTAAILFKNVSGQINEMRIAMGGVGPNILRLRETEKLLTGQRVSADLFEQAAQLAEKEIKPISDVRGTAEFRYKLAGNIIRKFFHELGDGRLPLHSGNGNGNGHGNGAESFHRPSPTASKV